MREIGDRTIEIEIIRKIALDTLTPEDKEPALSDRVIVEEGLRRIIRTDFYTVSSARDLARLAGADLPESLEFVRTNLRDLLEVIGNNQTLRREAFSRFKAFGAGRDGD